MKHWLKDTFIVMLILSFSMLGLMGFIVITYLLYTLPTFGPPLSVFFALFILSGLMAYGMKA